MTSDEILDRLAAKHAKDVFVPECKDGPTWTGSHLRLDAWVMPRSWSKYHTTGYEIKVSRSDFLRDQKMADYMPLCNIFFVVAPAGVVQSFDELPEGAGLMIASPKHRKLIVKKKAQQREIDDPVFLYRYILMTRAAIRKHVYSSLEPEANERFWRDWLEHRVISRDLGHRVSRTLREEINHKIVETERESKRVSDENERYAEIRQLLDELGISTRYHFRSAVAAKLAAYKAGFPEEVRLGLENAKESAARLQELVQRIEDALARELNENKEVVIGAEDHE